LGGGEIKNFNIFLNPDYCAPDPELVSGVGRLGWFLKTKNKKVVWAKSTLRY
jgi:hypothetical protein